MSPYCTEFGHAFRPWPKARRLYCSQCGETKAMVAAVDAEPAAPAAPPADRSSPTNRWSSSWKAMRSTGAGDAEAEILRLRDMRRRAMRNGQTEGELLEEEDVGHWDCEPRRVPVDPIVSDEFQPTGHKRPRARNFRPSR